MRLQNETAISINSEGLNSTQVRLVKSLHCLIRNVLTTQEESEFFDSSAELMKKCAEIVKTAQFAQGAKQIPYGEQAVEYAVDHLVEQLGQGIETFDN